MTWEHALRYLSGAELSRITGVRESTISRGRKTGGELRARHAVAIAHHLGLSTDEFLNGRSNKALQQAREIIKKMYESVLLAENVGGNYLDHIQSSGPLPIEIEPRLKPEPPPPAPSAPIVGPDPNDSYSVYEAVPEYAHGAPPSLGFDSVPMEQNRNDPDAAADTLGPVPFAGRMAAGPPIDTERWPGEWLPIRLRRRESAQTHYLAQAVGTSMVDAGIADGALVLVRRAEAAQHDQIVVVWLPGDGLTIKRYRLAGGRPVLAWEDGSGRTVPLREGARVQGVFVRVVE